MLTSVFQNLIIVTNKYLDWDTRIWTSVASPSLCCGFMSQKGSYYVLAVCIQITEIHKIPQGTSNTNDPNAGIHFPYSLH